MFLNVDSASRAGCCNICTFSTFGAIFAPFARVAILAISAILFTRGAHGPRDLQYLSVYWRPFAILGFFEVGVFGGTSYFY